jgi:hypothetical protein
MRPEVGSPLLAARCPLPAARCLPGPRPPSPIPRVFSPCAFVLIEQTNKSHRSSDSSLFATSRRPLTLFVPNPDAVPLLPLLDPSRVVQFSKLHCNVGCQ